MRAIITCDTCINDDNLRLLLAELNLCPNRNIGEDQLKKLKELIKIKRTEISTDIPGEGLKEIIDATVICTIFDGETKTWGIVSRPNKYRISFRLKNPVASRLKNACESLVRSLRSEKTLEFLIREGHVNKNTNIWRYFPFLHSIFLPKEYFHFYPLIEILEKNSDQYSFSGKIVHRSAFAAAVEERTIEFYIILFSGFIAIFLLYLTSPASLLDFANFGEWKEWVRGNMERVSTAALLTMIISGLELFLHWMTIRRESSIKWTA